MGFLQSSIRITSTLQQPQHSKPHERQKRQQESDEGRWWGVVGEDQNEGEDQQEDGNEDEGPARVNFGGSGAFHVQFSGYCREADNSLDVLLGCWVVLQG